VHDYSVSNDIDGREANNDKYDEIDYTLQVMEECISIWSLSFPSREKSEFASDGGTGANFS
jgi:hypothetical protein